MLLQLLDGRGGIAVKAMSVQARLCTRGVLSASSSTICALKQNGHGQVALDLKIFFWH